MVESKRTRDAASAGGLKSAGILSRIYTNSTITQCVAGYQVHLTTLSITKPVSSRNIGPPNTTSSSAAQTTNLSSHRPFSRAPLPPPPTHLLPLPFLLPLTFSFPPSPNIPVSPNILVSPSFPFPPSVPFPPSFPLRRLPLMPYSPNTSISWHVAAPPPAD